MARDLQERWPYKDTCLNHINEEENEHLTKSKYESFSRRIEIIRCILAQDRDESANTDDQVRTLSDGREIHPQSRMFAVPEKYYKNKRKIFDFFNLEYLEADGYFILRIVATNAR